MERGPEKSEKYDFDEKSGHVKFKGSLRPDGTQRRDRMIKISTGYFSKKDFILSLFEPKSDTKLFLNLSGQLNIYYEKNV